MGKYLKELSLHTLGCISVSCSLYFPAIPGVELGAGKKDILDMLIQLKPLKKMQMKQRWMEFLFVKPVFFFPWKLVMLESVSHVLLRYVLR